MGGESPMDGIGGLWDRMTQPNMAHGAELRSDVPINVINAKGKVPFDYSAIRFMLNGTDYKLVVGDGTLGALMKKGCDKTSGLKCDDIGGYFPLPVGVTSPLPAPEPSTADAKELLFDLGKDPTEHHDLVATLPAVAQHGRMLLRQYADSGNYQEPQSNFPHIRSFPAFHKGTW